MASDARGLRDLTLPSGRPVVVGITVAQIEHERSQAARYREALERITAAHVAGASAGELADRARGVLRGGGGHE